MTTNSRRCEGGGGGGILVNLGEGVLHASWNPYPISDINERFSLPNFRLFNRGQPQHSPNVVTYQGICWLINYSLSYIPFSPIRWRISLFSSTVCWKMYENCKKKLRAHHSCKGNTPANAWSVVPPIWQAAAPVLAVTKVLWGGSIVIKRFNRYDLPVPALPVKNTLLPALIAFITAVCSGIRFIWKELKQLRRFLAAPLCPLLLPWLELFSFSVVFTRFGVTPFLSSSGLFLLPIVKSLSVRGLMFSNDRAFSLRRRLLLLVSPFSLLWASFNDKHFKKAASWFGGQFENMICVFCVRSLIVAFPSCKNRLWMVNSFRRNVLPSGDWLLIIRREMSRNSSLPRTTVILLYVRRLVTTPLELRLSTVRQHSNSLASITQPKKKFRVKSVQWNLRTVASLTFKFWCPKISSNHIWGFCRLQSSLVWSRDNNEPKDLGIIPPHSLPFR